MSEVRPGQLWREPAAAWLCDKFYIVLCKTSGLRKIHGDEMWKIAYSSGMIIECLESSILKDVLISDCEAL